MEGEGAAAAQGAVRDQQAWTSLRSLAAQPLAHLQGRHGHQTGQQTTPIKLTTDCCGRRPLTQRDEALQAQHGHLGLLPRRRRQAGRVPRRLRALRGRGWCMSCLR